MIRVGDKTVDWKPGMTVAQALEHLDDGGFYAVVRVDGKLVSRPRFATTVLEDGAVLEPIPMIAGG